MSAAQPMMLSRPSDSTRRRAHKQESPENTAPEAKLCVYVCAENRLLREALAHVLTRPGNIEVLTGESPATVGGVLASQTGVLLLASRGNITEDLELIRQVHEAKPGVRILLIGMARGDHEFLQCVRAGISGYLLRDATSAEVLEGVCAVHAGEAVCPGPFCAALFRIVAQGAVGHLSGAGRQAKLSRRESQILALLADGLSNKEIARTLCRSEQTIKNHLNRMRHKLGVRDRLEMAELYYAAGLFAKDEVETQKNR